MTDHNLPLIMEEITALLKRHDVVGMVFLASPPIGEVGYNFTTSWSCATIEGREFASDAEDVDKFKSTVTAISALHRLAGTAQEDTIAMLKQMHDQRPFRSREEPSQE